MEPDRLVPYAGLLLVARDGRQWLVRSVLYDEAGPDRVVITARDCARGPLLHLDLRGWCNFCADNGICGAQPS